MRLLSLSRSLLVFSSLASGCGPATATPSEISSGDSSASSSDSDSASDSGTSSAQDSSNSTDSGESTTSQELPEESGDDNVALSWPNSGTEVLLIGLHSHDGKRVWAAGSAGEFTVSKDAGKSWSAGKVQAATADKLEFRDVEVRSDDLIYLMAAGPVELSRIYRSDDAGKTWDEVFRSAIEMSFFDCMTFLDDSHGLVYGDSIDGKLMVLETTDGKKFAPIDQSKLPPALAAEAGFASSGACAASVGNKLAWLGTGGSSKGARVLRTEDGGESFEAIDTPILATTATQGITAISFYDATNGYIFGADVAEVSDSGDVVAFTSDGGKTWERRGKPTTMGMNYGGAVSPDGKRLVVVGPKGMSYSLDGAKSWQSLSVHNLWTVTFLSETRAVAAGKGGKIVVLDFSK